MDVAIGRVAMDPGDAQHTVESRMMDFGVSGRAWWYHSPSTLKRPTAGVAEDAFLAKFGLFGQSLPG